MYGRFVKGWLPDKMFPDEQLVDDKELESVGEEMCRFERWEEYGKVLREHGQRILRNSTWGRLASELPLESRNLGLVMVESKKRLRWDGTGASLRGPEDELVAVSKVLNQGAVDSIVA
ncbi:MAG: hypothetical protein MMC33_003640 [Icmadophila ericetorum]|nr:hypothetical protein [Icmadophila ericetorum]